MNDYAKYMALEPGTLKAVLENRFLAQPCQGSQFYSTSSQNEVERQLTRIKGIGTDKANRIYRKACNGTLSYVNAF